MNSLPILNGARYREPRTGDLIYVVDGAEIINPGHDGGYPFCRSGPQPAPALWWAGSALGDARDEGVANRAGQGEGPVGRVRVGVEGRDHHNRKESSQLCLPQLVLEIAEVRVAINLEQRSCGTGKWLLPQPDNTQPQAGYDA